MTSACPLGPGSAGRSPSRSPRRSSRQLMTDRPPSAGIRHALVRPAAGRCRHTPAQRNRPHLHAAGRVFADRRVAGTASVVPAAPAHGPLAVKLIAGHGAGGRRRDPAGTPRPGPGPGHELPDGQGTPAAGPGSSSGPAPVRRPGPGNVTTGPAGCGSVRRDVGGRRCPERPHPIPASR